MKKEFDTQKAEQKIKNIKQNLRNYIDGVQIIKYLPAEERASSIQSDIIQLNKLLEDEQYQGLLDATATNELIAEGKAKINALGLDEAEVNAILGISG